MIRKAAAAGANVILLQVRQYFSAANPEHTARPLPTPSHPAGALPGTLLLPGAETRLLCAFCAAGGQPGRAALCQAGSRAGGCAAE